MPDNNEPAEKLRRITFFNGGEPYTAFVALTDAEFSDVIAADTGDLSNYSKHVLLVIEGHDPSFEDRQTAWEVFNRMYGSKAIGRRDEESPEAG
ncbi:hypothetical protein [Zavarzinella formosa]|uniref:hypothetical protein n=1 Tax=Zavarzinella formosa TaxID=360055 RepID=UPI0002FB1EA3|nr:hypothetical protein [Zavarzinella formosa]